MDNNKENNNSVEPGRLTEVCSRLAGDNLCRCGSNLKGRYCLWNYFSMPESLNKSLSKAGQGKIDKILKQWREGDKDEK